LLVALAAFAASAYDRPSPTPTKLEGVITDFSPTTTSPAGPYLVSGPWSLQWQPSGKAQFTASLTMVRPDATSQATRNFHTHHITVDDGEVTVANNTLTVTGAITVTSNGNEVFPGSTVQIVISGGTALPLTNLSLTFAGPVAAHFTGEPYEGVVLVQH
jgi:hypothetical protein